VRLVFAGTPEVALPSLSALLASQHEVVAVVTRPDAPAGRGRSLQASPVAALAEEHGIEVLKPERPRDPDFLARLAELEPDCCPVVAYGALVPRAALDIPRLGWVNLHFSLLPAWRGAAPVQRSLLAGERESGVTTFKIDRGMDTGPIYVQSSFTYAQDECATEALERMAEIGAKQLMNAVAMIEGGIAPIPQQGQTSNAPKIDKRELRLRLGSTSVELMAQIRAFTSEPGVWFLYRGQRMIISKARQSSIKVEENHIKDEHGNLLIGTRDGSIEIEKITPEGKREMSGSEFLRGRDLRQAHPIE